jgi:hypothetical protein
MVPELLTAGLALGRIARVDADGTVLVNVDDDAKAPLRCIALETASAVTPLGADDLVIVVRGNASGGMGVVLGRPGMPWVSAPGAPPGMVIVPGDQPDDPPVSLTLQATDELTLRVGDGSITIRKDGRILIKGKDLVSHAQRMNRIKGGAVSIN